MQYKSCSVNIGNIPLGGGNPVRIQSMTSTDTLDTKRTVAQSLELIRQGCEYVRITAPSVKAAENLSVIKKKIRQAGYQTPIIADIHFNPKAAGVASRIVEKIRINPGNFIDQRATPGDVNFELEIISDKLIPLLKICKEYGTAVRIGVNHGSLSKRILHEYGNTPEGMVASALEYIDICRSFNFHELVLSLKSSNIRIMIEAYLLLVRKFIENDMHYPLHLGVTEAGDAEDGRIKSAAGIGSLLMKGIGDTIRVSLTEDPVHEIPVCRKIIDYVKTYKDEKPCLQQIENYDHSGSPLVISQEDIINADLSIFDDYVVDKQGKRYLIKDADNTTEHSSGIIILTKEYSDDDMEAFIVKAAMDFTSPLLEKNIHGICIKHSKYSRLTLQTSFDILQATGLRISKTEFIACPSCGRTLFDIQTELQKVKNATSHLKGLKIAVMGCIVNGPGEMADADYGYVGSGRNKVTLYKNKQNIYKNVDAGKAVETLVKMIKENGDWTEVKPEN